jgi:hypothetical protein
MSPRAYMLGWHLGRWWHDPDARVCAGVVLLLGIWLVLR